MHGSPREQTLDFLCGHPELASRIKRGTEQEFAEALRQIGFISRLRLSQRVSSASSLQAA
ncbi:putative uricase [Comamonas thiooxydans]|nr:putative uricase [Comamonas thiooxydans]